MLGLAYNQFQTKVLDAGLLQKRARYSAADLRPFIERGELEVTAGTLAVLRTRGAHPSDDPLRPQLGVHTTFDNSYLASTCLRWWRGDPDRILACNFLVVTTGRIPCAIFEVDGLVDSQGSGTDRRHHFAGRLLARVKATAAIEPGDTRMNDLDGFHGEDDCFVSTADGRADPATLNHCRKILQSRVTSNSGGPIAYLPDPVQSA